MFVPVTDDGNLVVNSAGDVVAGFTPGDASTWGGIHNGAWFCARETPFHNLSLDGKVYGDSKDNPAIGMYSGNGITFDLGEIRNNSGFKITKFHSLFGVSETSAKYFNLSSKQEGRVDVWVIVDGEKRFVKKDIHHEDNALNIKVDIDNADKYLTLVVMSSDDGQGGDWALFAEPVLVLE